MPRVISPAQMQEFVRRLQMKAAFLGSELKPTNKSPDLQLGELFQDVQLKRIYPDGMTFVDMVPLSRLRTINKVYQRERKNPRFDLSEFVKTHFRDYITEESSYHTNPKHTIVQHIDELWDVLTRTAYKNDGSLVPLPYPYIVPGGRFGAQWYWDSYFIMLGLAAADRWSLMEGMVKNTAFMIRKFGRVPSGNRTYYLTRSQPPVFALMIRLLAQKQGRRRTYVRYLPYLLAEYRFWMKGKRSASTTNSAKARVVHLGKGEILNRYYDDRQTPRAEMYKNDVDTAHRIPDRTPSHVYVDIRAAAESGWDFSSRWCVEPNELATIHTTDIIPVDLNCLLAMHEQTIAECYRILKQDILAKRFERLVEQRKAALDRYCWDDSTGFYYDYNFVDHTHTGQLTLAGMFPLFAGLASDKQAAAVARVLQEKFLKSGGLVTTLHTNGEQWDAPNGWAPLHWVAIEGLKRYGHDELAQDITRRWISTNQALYDHYGKLVEKYNVVDPGMSAGGGEYALQDGFGWTNGVLRALLADKEKNFSP